MMLWAAAALCFFGFLRPGDVVALAEAQFDPSVNLVCGDVRVDSIVDPRLYVSQFKMKISYLYFSNTPYYRTFTTSPVIIVTYTRPK